MIVRRLRSVAGLAAAIVPFAIVVHLAAEAAATERTGLNADFGVRHAYLGAVFAAAVLWFAATIGVGRRQRERRRRCALLRAQLAGLHGRPSLALLIAANIGFFGLTQVIEGAPITSGAMPLGLAVALGGSLLAALVVFAFGSRIVAAGLDSVIGTSPLQRASMALYRSIRRSAGARHATTAYSLFIPNRPPPVPFSC
jgi:hypothetical protein